MSGGSFNYLFCHVKGLEHHDEDLQRMADRLTELGAPDAAEATRAVLSTLEQAEQQADALEDVWHDVEWYDSGDNGWEQVERAFADYRARRSGTP